MTHPYYPVVEGHYQMTQDWSVMLPGKFNRRVEDDDLVIWRPDLTIWVTVWANDDNKTNEECLAWIKEGMAEDAFDLQEEREDDILRFRYRLVEDDENDSVSSYYCFAISSCGYVQMAIYFDSEDDAGKADSIWRSLSNCNAVK